MGWARVKVGLRVLSVSRFALGLYQAEHEPLLGRFLAIADRLGLRECVG